MSKKLLLVSCLLVLSSAVCAATYTVREASGLPDGASVFDVNNYGQAAGLYTGADGRSRALRWVVDGAMVDLGQGYGVDINNYGQILVQSPAGSFVSNPDGTVLDLRSVISGQFYPQRINDLGWVTGYVLVSTGRYRGFVWSAEAGTMLLGLLAGDATGFAMDVNNRGQVAGYSLNSGQSYARPFLWSSESGLSELAPAPDATYSTPFRINDVGQIIGSGSGYLGYRSVLWNPDGSVVDLGIGEASDLNNLGQVIVSEYPGSYVLNPDGNWVELPQPLGALGIQAYGINDNGVAVGKTITASGMARATIWEPQTNPEVSVVTVSVDIRPNSINTKSKGPINCFIELPAGHALEDIDVASLRLEGVQPVRDSGVVGDDDGDGVPDLQVQFSREALCGVLQAGSNTVVLTGSLVGDTPISGEAVIEVVQKGK